MIKIDVSTRNYNFKNLNIYKNFLDINVLPWVVQILVQSCPNSIFSDVEQVFCQEFSK